ncbi:MAG: hypothetical protein ACRDP6_13800 [Actinoallomurus sp.]
MSEWGIALIAAGSALGGSVITGWYTRIAGWRQAEAARHAGDRQADALLDTVRMTLEEQRVVRVLDLRRQTYLRFLDAAETAILTRRTGASADDERLGLQRAYGAVLLEGPADVAQAARELIDSLRREPRHSLDDLERTKREFVDAAQVASNSPGTTLLG